MSARLVARCRNPMGRCKVPIATPTRWQAAPISKAPLAASCNPTTTSHHNRRHFATSRETGTNVTGLPKGTAVGTKRFADFDLAGKAFVVTGGARGLGLAMAEALVEAGGKVYCLDRLPSPDDEYQRALERVVPEWGGSLQYKQLDVNDTAALNRLMEDIAAENEGIQGVIAAAGIQQLTPAIDYTAEDVNKMLQTNYTGVFMTAQAAARQMFKYKNRGSICFVASMSGTIANKGLLSAAYNSSKAAVIQLSRNLAMEWSSVKENGEGGIRVNSLSPGHIVTPMVLKNFEEVPGLRETWSQANMMGRLAETSEFKGAALFLMSNASTFMTGSNLIIDGGHTAW